MNTRYGSEERRMVIEAEAYLANGKAYIEEAKALIQVCNDQMEKRKLQNALEQDIIRFSQMMADVVIFKAQYGIFTDPEDIKRIK